MNYQICAVLCFALLASILIATPSARGQSRDATAALSQRQEAILRALHLQESGGAAAVPPHTDCGSVARGPLQIHEAAFKDSGIAGSFEDCDGLDFSLRVVAAYLNRYEGRAWRDGDAETLARCYNAGPGWRRHPAKTDAYWAGVQSHLAEERF